MTRERFLQRVRRAARDGAAYRVERREIAHGVGRARPVADLAAAAATEIEAVGGRLHRAATDADARQVVADVCRQHHACSAICWRHPLLDRLALDDLLGGQSIERLDELTLAGLEPSERQARLLAADIGITGADWVIAETGTLMLAATAGQPRVASLLPPVHVTLAERSRLVADLYDVFDTLDPARLPSSLTFITGPSKSGDIDLELTTGVHGPGELHLVLVG